MLNKSIILKSTMSLLSCTVLAGLVSPVFALVCPDGTYLTSDSVDGGGSVSAGCTGTGTPNPNPQPPAETWTCGYPTSLGLCQLAEVTGDCRVDSNDVDKIVRAFRGEFRDGDKLYPDWANIASSCISNYGNTKTMPIIGSNGPEYLNVTDISAAVDCARALPELPNCSYSCSRSFANTQTPGPVPPAVPVESSLNEDVLSVLDQSARQLTVLQAQIDSERACYKRCIRQPKKKKLYSSQVPVQDPVYQCIRRCKLPEAQ